MTNTVKDGHAREAMPYPLCFGPVFASALIPGLGQLSQKRYSAFFGHFCLFLMGLGASYSVPYFLVLSIVLSAFSAVDAAVWVKDTPNPMCVPMERLYIVMLVCGIVALLVPFVMMARENARRMQCVPKQIGVAFLNYHDTYGSLPPAYTVDENGKPLHSWRVLLLPFIEERNLYEKIRLDEPWDSEYNRQFHEIDHWSYVCPSGPAAACAWKNFRNMKQGNCYYSVIIGPETPFPGAEATKLSDCIDGESKTLLIVERMTPICWMDPNNEIRFDTACEGVNRNLLGIGSAHPGGANCSFMDTSCPFLLEGVDLKPFLTKSAGDDADVKVFSTK